MDALTASPMAAGVGPAEKGQLNLFNMSPAWGSYLYQNVMPNLPSDWLLNANLGNDNNAAQATLSPSTNDLFSAWSNLGNVPTAAPSAAGNYYYGGSIAPSLLAPTTGAQGTVPGTASGAASAAAPSSISPATISPVSVSLDMVDKALATPSPLGSGPTSFMSQQQMPRAIPMSSRQLSIDSDADGEVDPDAEDARSHHSLHSHHSHASQHSHPSEHDHDSMHDHDEGVERDGMIWGMKVEQYRALSARERKRVRNRISARTFRAKRKEHLSSLESTLGAKDLEVKVAREENARLRREVAELRRRLALYEQQPQPF